MPWLRLAGLRLMLTLLLGGWLVFLVAEASAHFVHHLFDADGDAGCAFLAAADHAPAATAPADTIRPELPVQERLEDHPSARARSASDRPSLPRGPPAAPPALA